MRLGGEEGPRSHDSLSGIGSDDHHPSPVRVSIDNITQVLAGGTDYNLDIPLGKSGLSFARVQLMGPDVSGGGGNLWRESAAVHVTDDTGDAIGHSVRTAGNFRSYVSTYSKAVGTTNLSHKIFDNDAAGRRIALKDASIVGSVLRLVFHNYDAGPKTLWVRGEAVLW